MAAKLKVFVTSDGLTEYAVATTSRPKALAAWGVHQDLFKQGAARESDDAALAKAALASPGEVVERAANSKAAAKALKAPARKPGPSKAALKRIRDLEAKLSALEARRQEELAGIDRERAELADREAQVLAGYEAERARLSGRLKAARA